MKIIYIFILHLTLYIVQCTLYTVQYTLCSVQCTQYNIMCTLLMIMNWCEVHCGVYSKYIIYTQQLLTLTPLTYYNM